MEQMLEERANVENMSQHGSNSRHQVNPRCEEYVGEAHHNAQGGEDEHELNEEHGHSDEDDDLADEEENLLDQRQAATPSLSAMKITNPSRNDDAPRYAHDTLFGKDVILFAMLRSNLPVAKGTIVSTNPSTIVGGRSLGKQFCEVIVNEVTKWDAILPRPYDNMDSMAAAYMMSIAWPYKRLKVSNKAGTRSS